MYNLVITVNDTVFINFKVVKRLGLYCSQYKKTPTKPDNYVI